MYESDSLFTLSGPQIAGVLAVSALLATALAAALGLLFRRLRSTAARIALAVLALWLFVWLSPQAYYTYYRAVIPGLPAQWVIGVPPGPERIARLLAFSARATLSDHGKGLLGWGLLLWAAAPLVRRQG